MNKNVSKFYDPFSALTNAADTSAEKELFNDDNAQAKKAVSFFLVRKDTNEKIAIRKNVFKIGTKADMCDYVVTDNKYVGRNHAQIIIENSAAFFVDNNSTNKSYINGQQAAPNQKIRLASGCEVKLANLPFTFFAAE